MNNQFDTDNYPTQEPDTLSAGERWAWVRPDITGAYPTDSYTLKYLLTLQSSASAQLVITALKTAEKHVIEVGKAITDGYTAGDYAWQAVIVRDSDGEEVVVDDGLLLVVAQTGDIRSHSQKVLQAIRALIEGTATRDQQEYTINGRTLKRRSIPELLEIERVYAARWKAEKKAIARKAGRLASTNTLVKMGA
jgi:hypothetical protein